MRRLQLQLLAAFALLSAVNDESYCLVFRCKFSSSGGIEKIEKIDLDQCNTQGNKFSRGCKQFLYIN
tara:strand:+ start:81 stop:281 length:201 start_codon:yes stop_codon:yes gene_type:complete